MNRIEKRLAKLQEKGEKAFITYMTAGLPDMEGTKEIIKAQQEAGTDILELGIPFSDPIADGPVIQQASYEAILKFISESKGIIIVVDQANDVFRLRPDFVTFIDCDESNQYIYYLEETWESNII